MRRFFLCCLLSFAFFTQQSHAIDKIALLFLTIDDLNHPNLWQEELEKNPDKFSVYIHSRDPIKSSFFSQFRIDNIIRKTATAFHSKAWPELFREAVKDENNKKFVLLSESCIPLFPLADIYEQLIHDDHTYISYGRPWWPENHDREVIELPKEHRWVNQEWVIFNRTHAEVVASDSYVVDIVSRHRSDSESYFSILLSFYGYLHDSNVVDRQTTYVNWVFGKDGHPYMFRENNEFTLSLMQEAKAQGSLFARKFSRSFPEKDLKEFIKKEPK